MCFGPPQEGQADKFNGHIYRGSKWVHQRTGTDASGLGDPEGEALPGWNADTADWSPGKAPGSPGAFSPTAGVAAGTSAVHDTLTPGLQRQRAQADALRSASMPGVGYASGPNGPTATTYSSRPEQTMQRQPDGTYVPAPAVSSNWQNLMNTPGSPYYRPPATQQQSTINDPSFYGFGRWW